MQNTALILSDIENAKVWKAPNADERKREILELSAAIVKVTNPAELEAATARQREIKRMLAEVETTRQAVKTPVLNLGRKIDEIAAAFCLELENEAERIGGNPKKRIAGLIGNYVAQEAERVRKEQEALEEERRKKEAAAAAAIAEANRINEENQRKEAERIRKEQEAIEAEKRRKQKELDDAIAEQQRLASLKRVSADKQAAAEREIAEAKAALEKANAAQVSAAKPDINQEIEMEKKIIETQSALQQVQTIAPPKMARAAGLTVSTFVDFEITDAAALYAVRPEWFTLEPKKSVIKASISKTTSLPGLKVWEATKAGTRG